MQQNQVSATMYTKAKKIAGYWTVLLESSGLVQFRSLSRKAANTWASVNEPLPAPYVLNSTSGTPVWRARN
jgi:hypothetical protein